MIFYLLDVFAQERYQGNQLCVFPDAAHLTSEQMLALAREINFAETTFITGGSIETGFQVRIFTPEYEVPFAGHPVLGTSYVIAAHFLQEPHPDLTLHLPVGPIQTRSANGLFWLQATQPRFGQTFDCDSLAELLGLSKTDFDAIQPIQWVSTGLPYLIIPLLSLRPMRAIRIDAKACQEWLTAHRLYKTMRPDGLTTAFFPFCTETYSAGHQLNARMLCLENGRMLEDAATGSASSCLLAYLLRNRPDLGASLRLQLEQGYEINRPSLIELEGTLMADNVYTLHIGGRVQFVAKGEWTL
jgi:trans-2,3-dihydro-3-hydroxyanthranilate isomerase